MKPAHRQTKFRLIASLSAVAVVAAVPDRAMAAKNGDRRQSVRSSQRGVQTSSTRSAQGGTSGVFTVDRGTNREGNRATNRSRRGCPTASSPRLVATVDQCRVDRGARGSGQHARTATVVYFGVVRNNPKANVNSSDPDGQGQGGGRTPHRCTWSRTSAAVRSSAREVDRNLELLDKQVKEANAGVRATRRTQDPTS